MKKTEFRWLAIGLLPLISMACGAPRTESAPESGSRPETEKQEAEEAVFTEDFEEGNEGDWNEAASGEGTDDPSTEADPEIE